MLYKLAHNIRTHCEWLWDSAELINSWAFGLRYCKEIKMLPSILASYREIRIAQEADAQSLAAFFANQQEQDFNYFRPHLFDELSLIKLIKQSSFLMFVVEYDGTIVGYFFLRCFVNGQCYLGKMVDYRHQGQGIGKQMCRAAMEIAQFLKLRMFESINKENMASMRSSGSVLKQIVVKELDHGDLLIEDLPLEKS